MPGTNPTPFQIPVLFPFEPDGVDPIVETVEYVTDVITSHNDTEDRIALRRRPKLHLKWRMTAMDLGEAGRAAGLLWKMGNRWYVPMWQHARRATGLDEVLKSYTLDMIDEFMDFSGKVLVWKNSNTYDIMDWVADGADGVVLSSGPVTTKKDLVTGSSGDAQVALNAPGLDGTPNTATTITDSSATVQQRRAFIVYSGLPATVARYTEHWLVAKDAITTRAPYFELYASGGTAVTMAALALNTQTGQFVVAGGVGTVRDAGAWWLVSLSGLTNGTNTAVSMAVYPALRATYNGANSVANTGSIVVAQLTGVVDAATSFVHKANEVLVVPLGVGTLSQSYKMNRTNIVAGADVAFELDTTSAAQMPTLTPTQTFRGSELLNIHPDTDDGADEEQWTLSSERVGSDLGPFQIRLFATSPVLARKAQWTLTGRAEFNVFRKWLATRRGRRVPLWVPTYQDDLTLVATALINAGSIDIAAVDFANKFMGSTTRVKIAVIQNGIIMPLVVTSVTVPSTGVERLFLESTTTAAVGLNAKVCFLLYARLTDDKVSIEYHNIGLATVEAGFTELPRETPA